MGVGKDPIYSSNFLSLRSPVAFSFFLISMFLSFYLIARSLALVLGDLSGGLKPPQSMQSFYI
jgi:hypothetical protein